MKKKNTLWYVRQQDEITGPFPSRVITNNILLGRLTLEDQASLDRVSWQAIQSIPALLPERDIDIGTKINLEGRNGFDRRQTAPDDNNTYKHLRSKSRRTPEPEDTVRRRQFHTLLMLKFREQQSLILWPLLLVGLLLISVISLAIISPTLLPISEADCQAPAGIAINWNNCLKSDIDLANIEMNNAQMRSAHLSNANFMNATLTNADMAYADLRASNFSYAQLQNTNLVGADLGKADLSYADLSNADLSYANLSNANLSGSILDNVSFDHAIWPNGDICSALSVGKCIRVKP